MSDKKRDEKTTHIQLLLAQNIKAARARLKWTQEMLAEKTDLTTTFIGELEICRKFPRPKTLQKIADALGLKPYQLFFESTEGKELEKQRQISELYLELKAKIEKDLEETLMKFSRE